MKILSLKLCGPNSTKSGTNDENIEIAQNFLKIDAKPILSVLITNMDKDFENVVTRVVQMA